MKFSTKTRYGLRFMVNLGANASDKPVQLSEIARLEDISEKYLSQIVIPLKSRGLVISERGANGGYRLGKTASEITVKEIVQTFEGSLYPVDCITEADSCDRSSHCVTQQVWKKAGDALIITLENITLESLITDYLKQKQVIDYSI